MDSLNTIGCAASNTGFTVTNTGVTGTERWRTIVDAGGLRYMDEDAGFASNGTYPWHLHVSSSGGPTTGTWPIPAGIPVIVNFEYITGAGGPVVFQRQVVLSRCDGGTITSDVVLIPSQIIPTLGEYGMIALGLLVLLVGGLTLRRRSASIG